VPHSERIISEMPAETKKPLEALRNAALTAAGLIIAATPLALWVAWPQATFVLGVGAGAAFGLLFFHSVR
jgi:cation transport ATPase